MDLRKEDIICTSTNNHKGNKEFLRHQYCESPESMSAITADMTEMHIDTCENNHSKDLHILCIEAITQEFSWKRLAVFVKGECG